MKGAKKLPRILTPAEVQAVLDACVHLRDRFLFALLYDSGIFSRGRPVSAGLVSAFVQLTG